MEEMIMIPGSERRVTNWSGGTSSEVYIWPETAEYGKRDFLFRVSTAAADTDEISPYTDLPGVERHLLMLKGTAEVVHKNRYSMYLTPYGEVDTFDGGWETYAKGRVRDFNLMTRDGCKGSLSVLERDTEISLDEDVTHALLFCGEGTANVSDSQNPGMILKAEDTLLLRSVRNFRISLSENSRLVLVIVRKA